MKFLVQIAVIFCFVGLTRSFGQTPEWKVFKYHELQGSPQSLAIDNKGNIWVPTMYNGVAMYDGKTWVSFTKENSDLPENGLKQTIAIDQQNNVYVAGSGVTEQNGFVAKFDGNSWTKLPITDSLQFLPHTLAVDKSGMLWIGSD